MNRFDLVEGEKQKAEGIAGAAVAREGLVVHAREIAAMIARAKGTVTADDVQRVLAAENRPDELGPAAGHIFRCKEFEFTGQRINSARVANHARELKVWKLRA